jgi:hypothetical protein
MHPRDVRSTAEKSELTIAKQMDAQPVSSV